MGRRSRNHTVPKFYLDGFADDSKSRSNIRYVWMYEKGCSSILKQSTKNIAVRADFYEYDVHIEGNKPQKLEDILGDLESETSPAIANIVHGILPDPRSKEIISRFISMLMMRVPNYSEAVQLFGEEKIRREMERIRERPVEVIDEIADVASATLPKGVDCLKEYWKLLSNDDFVESFSRDAWVSLMLDTSNDSLTS